MKPTAAAKMFEITDSSAFPIFLATGFATIAAIIIPPAIARVEIDCAVALL